MPPRLSALLLLLAVFGGAADAWAASAPWAVAVETSVSSEAPTTAEAEIEEEAAWVVLRARAEAAHDGPDVISPRRTGRATVPHVRPPRP